MFRFGIVNLLFSHNVCSYSMFLKWKMLRVLSECYSDTIAEQLPSPTGMILQVNDKVQSILHDQSLNFKVIWPIALFILF